MSQRPTSVTVIAWIIIVTSVLSLVSVLFTMAMNNQMARELMAKNPVPIPLQYLMSFLGLIISITVGIFMLKGANWARMLYIGWSAFGLLFGVFTSPLKLMLIPGVVIYAIFVFFLLRPKASAYFTRSANAENS